MKLLGTNEVLICVEELISMGLSRSYINLAIHRNQSATSISWKSIQGSESKRQRLVLYSTIPSQTIRKYNMPSLQEMVSKCIIQEALIKEENKKKIKAIDKMEVEAAFESAIENKYVKYTPFYNNYIPDNPNKVIALAKEHAYRITCVELNARRPKIKLKEIFEVQKGLPYKFVCSSYDKFVERHKKWRQAEINVIHGSFGKPRLYLTKMTDYVKALVEKYYKHPNQYTIEQITELVNTELLKKGLSTISSGSVSSYVNKPENKNRLMMYRNAEYFDNNVMPVVRRKDIKMAGDLYYADGTPLQIACWNKEMTKEIRLNFFAVIDARTKKIVGFNLAESEDRYNVIGAIKMAFELEGIVPFELKYDNASATKTEEFQHLKQMLELKGCRFTPTKKGNPKEKAQVERLFETFQSSYQRMIDGFLGEGIRSKRTNGRINSDFVNRLRSKENLYTYESMVMIVANLVNIYNQTGNRHTPSPSQRFAGCEKLRTNKIDRSDIAMLFWKHKTIKATRGEVSTTIRHNTYHYNIWDNELKLRLSGRSLKVYYDEQDLSRVHLFSLNDEYLCECRQTVMVHEGKAGQTEEDIKELIKRSKHVESIRTTVNKKNAEIRQAGLDEDGDDFLNMLSPFSVSKEKYNNAEGSIMLNYVAEQHSIDTDKLREYTPVSTELIEHEKMKRKTRKEKSPMAVKGHTITVLDENEE